MSRIPILGPDELSEEQRVLYDELNAGPRTASGSGRGLTNAEGGLVGPFNAWLHSPGLGRRISAVGEGVRFANSLPGNALEVGILTMAREWPAQFEWWAHARLATRAGVAEDVIAAIHEGQRPDFVSEDEAAVYDFACELLETRRVGDATYAAVHRRFGDRGVMDLVAVLGYYSLVSMTLNVFQVALPEGEAEPFPPC